MPKRLYIYITIAFLILPFWGMSQIIYSGHAKDVATGEDINDVEISVSGNREILKTNFFGDFAFSLYSNNSPNQSSEASFFQNILVWQGNEPLSLEIFDMAGRRVFLRNNLGNQGTFILPRLAYGIYIIRLNRGGDKQTLKAYSDGQKTFPVDKKADIHPIKVKPGFDTLTFTKSGYFTREIIVPKKDTFLKVGLLQGNYAELDYFNELINPLAFELVSTLPSRSHHGGVSSVKIIMNDDDGLLYYMNSKRFTYHYTFAKDVLNFRKGLLIFNVTQYTENPQRYLYPANLNYHKSLDKYVLHLVAANEMTCENIKRLYDKIIATSYLKGKLFFFANKAEWDLCEGIPTISSEELYEGQNYQALNLTKNYGYLTKVDIKDLEDTYLGRRDIILLNGIPNDVSVVAGIITTEFQTPLSHINVLSNSRGTPNMALKNGWQDSVLNSLVGELVYLNVRADTFELRKASLTEATAFWSQNEPQDTTFLPADLTTSGLINLENASLDFVNRIGGKAANFAEMLKVEVDGAPIPVPENSFAIPFYYYDQHMKDAGLDLELEQMLNDPVFQSDPVFRKQKLEKFQDDIKDHPLDPVLIALVTSEIRDFAEFSSFRFRSSTNAEDLEIFSGAGLYNSHSAKKGDAKKTIERAIKKVYASLWNWRAFEERSYFKIDHQSCAMGILVHRSFPDEDANGVMITRNLYNENPGFIINVQYKEESIVFPKPGIIHDQIMLLAWSITPGQNFMLEYLSFSNVPELNGQTVMTNEELFELGDYGMALKRHYYDNLPHSCGCSFNSFALDIEFKVDSEVSPRKIYIKQMRPFR